MKLGTVQIVVGGQFGSEAKGAIAAHLCVTENIAVAVRTGATNAGHTVYHEGRAFKMQQLPVGWVNPNVELILGAGALIDPAILSREIAMLEEAGVRVRNRLRVDHRAYIHQPAHAQRSKESDRHHAIGATGKGCSEALIDRVRLRGREDWTVGTYILRNDADFPSVSVCDTEVILNKYIDKGANVQLEGTQGQLLDLYLGPYPFTTHKQTGPAQWLSEAGLSPALETDIVLVARTYPIRVAGNSGPMFGEISWPYLARRINSLRDRYSMAPIVEDWAIGAFEDAVEQCSGQFTLPPGSSGLNQHMWSPQQRNDYRVALSELNTAAIRSLHDGARQELEKLFEITTVTRKLRRVAELSRTQLRDACRQVRPHRIALTFMNYLYPERWCTNDQPTTDETGFMAGLEAYTYGAPITHINRGPLPEHIVQVG